METLPGSGPKRSRRCLACGEAVEEQYTTCPMCGNDVSPGPLLRKKQMAPSEPDSPLRQTEVRYYRRHGKQRSGPLTLKELRSMVKVGRLVHSDLLWSAGMPEWIPASQVEGLFGPPPLRDSSEPRPRDVEAATKAANWAASGVMGLDVGRAADPALVRPGKKPGSSRNAFKAVSGLIFGPLLLLSGIMRLFDPDPNIVVEQIIILFGIAVGVGVVAVVRVVRKRPMRAEHYVLGAIPGPVVILVLNAYTIPGELSAGQLGGVVGLALTSAVIYGGALAMIAYGIRTLR